LLNRSLEVCAPWAHHWIVVDRGDLRAFRFLENERTTVVAKEELLPVWVHRLDTLKIGLRSNVWLQARGLPMRGWLLQQLVKLAIAEHLDQDVLVCADSDVVLLRPFGVSSVVDERDRVLLFARPDHVDERLPTHVRWHRSAEKLLGIEGADPPMPDFVSSLVPWKRENVLALLEHVEATTGRHWLRALASAWDVSEFTLYGRFAQDVLGTDAGHFVSTSPLCHDYYKHVPLSAAELDSLLDEVGPGEVDVSLTANAGMRPEQYVDVLERRWDEVAPPEPADAPAARPGRRVVGGGSAVASRRRDPVRLPVLLTWAVPGAMIILTLFLLQLALD
jgi:hypothetical protein